MDQDSYLFR